jgi:hypothetical protein
LSLLASSSPTFPLSDGFPSPNATQLLAIEQHSLGKLPNANLPSNISTEGITNLQLIALNEIAEVAFFTELISNLTNHVNGYKIPSEQHNLIVNALLAAQHVSSLSLIKEIYL